MTPRATIANCNHHFKCTETSCFVCEKEKPMDCQHNELKRQEDEAGNLYSCPACGEMFTTKVYEIGVQYGTKQSA